MTTTTMRRAAALAGAAVLAVAPPAAASHDADHGPQVPATWESATDGGQRADETASYAVTSPTTNNGVEAVFVSGVARKSNVLEAAGVRDLDVVTTAYDASTGAGLWSHRYDDDLGSDDRPVGLEISYDNNLLHAVADVGGEAVVLTYSATSGNLARTARVPGLGVNDTGISVAGSWLFLGGQTGGDFHVVGYENGPQRIGLDERPVQGEVFGVDAHNDYDNGDIGSWRTVVATGQETVFGSGGDVYTVAYSTHADGPLWERRWASPHNLRDFGVATEMTYSRTLGHGIVFVTGQTFDPDTGFDLWVTALDARTGADLWTGPDGGMRFFDGEASGDDQPVALRYHDGTETLYVTGTSERGAPHGEDIVTLAYDARTGDLLATAHASGDISNGRDQPTGLAISPDGDRVFVSAEIHNRLDTGGHRAGVFAYDADLDPAGVGLLSAGGAGVDQAAGVGVSLDGAAVLLGGGTDTGSTRTDLAGASFPVASFVAPPDPVIPEFPPGLAVLALAGIGALALGRRRRRPPASG